MAEYTYEIGGEKFVQRPLVLGQVRQLIAEISPLGGVNPDAGKAEIIAALIQCGQLERVLAVVLTPEGEDLRNKNIDALALEIEFGITPETIVRVIEDFFDCNPTASLLEKLVGVIAKVRQQLPDLKTIPTGSNLSSVSLPTETSPDETPSSGDSPPPSADPISGTEAER